MTFRIKNDVTKQVFEYPSFDIQDSRIFYHFSIMLNGNEPEGNYTYYLIDDEDKIIAKSMLQIGDYEPNNKTYTTENNGFTQYNG